MICNSKLTRLLLGSALAGAALLTVGTACSRRPPAKGTEPAASATSALSAPAPSASPGVPNGSSESGESNEVPKPAQKSLAAPLGSAPARGHYGAEFTGAPLQPLGRLLAAPDQFKDQPVTLNGVVKRVCQRKGCWMELEAGAKEDTARCRIRFKDYAFFVPTDAEGARAKVEGHLQVNRVVPARVKHLEEEGAVFDSKNADGSANETQLIASAVELQR